MLSVGGYVKSISRWFHVMNWLFRRVPLTLVSWICTSFEALGITTVAGSPATTR